MQHRLVSSDGQRTFVVVFDAGEEFAETMLRFAREQGLTAAHFTALGAFQDAKLGWFDPRKQDYEENEVREQVEVLSLVGNVADHEGDPVVHAHAVLGKRDATACGGHILEAHVRPTLEVTVTESPAHLHRVFDSAIGLPLIRPDVRDRPPQGKRRGDAGVRSK